ncbi:MAG: outer membrane beta-barrel protein [Alcanivorax sp.]|nr:outer membrane beta-barrel protein [Alcanivorax sp.]
MKMQLAGLALLLPGLALAETAPYIGVQGQYSRVDINRSDFDGLAVSRIDKSDYGYAVRVGMQDDLSSFTGNSGRNTVGLELGYIDFGEVSATTGGTDVTAELDGIELAVIGSTQVYNHTHVYLRVGGLSWNTDTSGAGASDSNDGQDVLGGAGLMYFINHVQIRGGYDYYKVDDHQVDAYSLGAQFRF